MKWWTDSFPGVEFLEGPASALDGYGVPYIKISLGGVVPEGGLQPSMSNASALIVMDAFNTQFRRYLRDSTVVYVRKWPTITENTIYELDTFEGDEPRLRPRVLSTISGRFTFYKEHPKP